MNVTSNNDLHLVIFTYSYPYGTIEQWLESEVPHIANRFKQVTIVPSHVTSNHRQLPDNAVIDTRLATERPTGIKRLALAASHLMTSRLAYSEIFSHPWVIFSWRGLKKLIIYHDNAYRVAKWLTRFLSQSTVNPQNVVLYTVWLVPQSIGISMVKQNLPFLKSISRAHRDDLYETDNNPPYLPFRRFLLQSLSTLFVISEHGRRYVLETYASYHPQCEIARVGINDPNFDNIPSTDGVFRIVSCSFMIQVKRLDLFIEGLSVYAQTHPEQMIDWQHIGDGPLRSQLTDLAKTRLPSSVSWTFQGYLSNPDVMAYYRNNPVDVFVNVSESEGIPAAIMEAQSCSIPCIATAVGGNPEIVDNVNGLLLKSNPSAADIAIALESFIQDTLHNKRLASKSTWGSLYNAPKNYQAFADRIVELLC